MEEEKEDVYSLSTTLSDFDHGEDEGQMEVAAPGLPDISPTSPCSEDCNSQKYSEKRCSFAKTTSRNKPPVPKKGDGETMNNHTGHKDARGARPVTDGKSALCCRHDDHFHSRYRKIKHIKGGF
jgi:hypothetical protein